MLSDTIEEIEESYWYLRKEIITNIVHKESYFDDELSKDRSINVSETYLLFKEKSIHELCPYKVRVDNDPDIDYLSKSINQRTNLTILINGRQSVVSRFNLLVYEWASKILHARINARITDEVTKKLECASAAYMISYLFRCAPFKSNENINIFHFIQTADIEEEYVYDFFKKSKDRITKTVTKLLEYLIIHKWQIDKLNKGEFIGL